jgi:hypothetical protein
MAIFHGKLDVSKLNVLEKAIVKTVNASVGDFRDWDAIEQWAAHIGLTLEKENNEVKLQSDVPIE